MTLCYLRLCVDFVFNLVARKIHFAFDVSSTKTPDFDQCHIRRWSKENLRCTKLKLFGHQQSRVAIGAAVISCCGRWPTLCFYSSTVTREKSSGVNTYTSEVAPEITPSGRPSVLNPLPGIRLHTR